MEGLDPVTVTAGRRAPLIRFVAVALGATVGLVACGGDDDDASGTDTTAASDTSASSDSVENTSPPGAATTTGVPVVSVPAVSAAPGYSAEPADGPLRQGLAGPGVYLLQSQLVALGYDAGPLDGQFGGKTHAAVVAFQRDKNLATDGVVGPQTAAALAEACAAVPACPSG